MVLRTSLAPLLRRARLYVLNAILYVLAGLALPARLYVLNGLVLRTSFYSLYFALILIFLRLFLYFPFILRRVVLLAC